MKKLLLILLVMIYAVLLFGSNDRFFVEAKKYFVQGNYDKAEEWFNLALKQTTVIPEYHYWASKNYIALQKYDLAYDHMQTYKEKNFGADLNEINAILSIIENQIELTRTGRNVYSLGRMNGLINSEYSDFAPVPFADGKKMYITSQRLNDDYAKENVFCVENIAGIWSDPVLIEELSSNRNESLGSFSEDDNEAYLFGNYLSNSKKGDIYMSRIKDGVWEKPALVSGINTDMVEIQPYVLNDVMFFASNREDGLGMLDLYVSEKIDGAWTKPENLGPVINTDNYEETPFLDWDGETLYFASNGHPGLGGFDIFKSVKIGDSWQDWSEPENLGLVVNSVKDERYYYNSSYELVAYIASNRFTGNGHDDIYKLNIAPPPEEEPMEIIEEEPIPIFEEASVIYELQNIFFDFDKADLKEESLPALNYLLEILMDNPTEVVEISGHTDNVGSNEYNLGLSERRAASVVEYLVGEGIPQENLISKGYGEEFPITSNETEEDRAINRRVEMKMVTEEEEPIEIEIIEE
ncbi:OmpA family protein [Candidatus Cloacimonadota bacterium]